MDTGYLFWNALVWIACLSVIAWAIGYGLSQWRGDRHAANRAFDRMVEEHRRNNQ